MISVPADDPVGALVPHTLQEPMCGRESGALSGTAFMVKDLFAVAGHKIANGNPAFFAANEPAKRNAPVVQALLDAGATLTGITVCDEFFYSLLGTNIHYGTPVNPRVPGHVTGGSSCGSAAAVAAGLCDFALGSDTGGSIRVPASFCGLYGLRPTFGRIDVAGATPMAPSYDTIGFLTREAMLARTIGGTLLDDRQVIAPVSRLLLADDPFARADSRVRASLEDALRRLREALPRPEHVTIAAEEIDRWRDAFRLIQGFEIQATLLPFIQSRNVPLGSGIKERFEMAARIKPEEAEEAGRLRAQVRAELHRIAKPGTVIALPSAPTLPPERAPDGGPEQAEFRALTLQSTCIAGHAGLPQISIPAASAEGFPIGLSFIAWAGGDEALLDLALRLEPLHGNYFPGLRP